ncbi:member of major facilitator superfamily multidrug-resistance, DHA1 sub-family [Panaeolus papilionaceus]|nr:member of major facilitator superfamily multidrug-resistance, DHA1 sub-family [Panaeolus papilionaceus]
MTALPVDEETPLLIENAKKPKVTPLPWFQFSIVLFLQLAEPLTSQVIYPFAPQLVRDLGVTHGNESKVGYYVGIMQSLFFLTQAFTVLHWSRFSDRIGRKPIILSGLFGLSLSMFCFGLSTTYWGAVFSRALNGALNGNIGVIKSIMAEMTDTTNISRAYAYQPIAWSTGSALGPMIGGSLARPAERFPSLFGNSEFHKKHPYFLPCAVPATFSAIAWMVTFFFLKETVKNPISVKEFLLPKKSKDDEEPSTPSTVCSDDDDVPNPAKKMQKAEKPLPLRELLTWRVIIAAANYASLSLVDIAFRAVQPLFLSTPIHLGGLGLTPPTIGKILSVYGVLNGVFQVFFFARLHDYYGSKKVFMFGVGSAIPLFTLFPIINHLAVVGGYSRMVWAAVGAQTVLSICLSLSYGAIFIFIAAASPNRASLGATNGLSQMTVSVMRAIGPAMANSLFSLSIEHKYLGGYLVYYSLLTVVTACLILASFLPRKLWTN